MTVKREVLIIMVSRGAGMEDRMDSKSIVPKGRVGSTPTRGTNNLKKEPNNISDLDLTER